MVPPNAASSQYSADASLILSSLTVYLPLSLILITLLIVLWGEMQKVRFNSALRSKPTESEKIYYQKYDNNAILRYYEFVREEIKREDEITHQRLTWSITFQGFLINALGVLMIFSWKDLPQDVYFLRKMALFVVGLIGWAMGLMSLKGVTASRNSISQVRAEWVLRNAVWGLYPRSVPQTFGQGTRFSGGTSYARFVPLFFTLMWCAYLFGYSVTTSVLWIWPCRDQFETLPTSVACLYEPPEDVRVPEFSEIVDVLSAPFERYGPWHVSPQPQTSP